MVEAAKVFIEQYVSHVLRLLLDGRGARYRTGSVSRIKD